MRRNGTGWKGFTLVELLVVIAIIGILVALIVPAVSTGISKSRRVKCAANLKGLGAAMHLYLDDHDMRMPMIEENTQFLQFSILGPYIDNDWNLLHCPSASVNDSSGLNWPAKCTTNVSGTVIYTDYKMADDADVVGKRVTSFRSDSWLVLMTDLDWHMTKTKDRHHGGNNMLFLDGSVQWKTEKERDTEPDPWGNTPFFKWGT